MPRSSAWLTTLAAAALALAAAPASAADKIGNCELYGKKGEASITPAKPGQGIGLAHVRALVRRLGGTMSVSSELNAGSTFTITLPIAWNVSKRN